MHITTRESLLLRLKNLDDQESWRDFFTSYWRLIYRVAVKSGLSDAEAQDVVQETVIVVAKKMPAFSYVPGRDSFQGWLVQLTRWKIADQFQKRLPVDQQTKPETKPGRRTAVIDRLPDPAIDHFEAAWDAEWKAHLLKVALQRVKRQVPLPQYKIFVEYAIKEKPAPIVAAAAGVTVEQVYLIKHRLADLVRKEIERLKDNPAC